LLCCFYFFFTDPPPTSTYTLSLHDALPIYRRADSDHSVYLRHGRSTRCYRCHRAGIARADDNGWDNRSNFRQATTIACSASAGYRPRRRGYYLPSWSSLCIKSPPDAHCVQPYFLQTRFPTWEIAYWEFSRHLEQIPKTSASWPVSWK